jgi:serine/threonine protein kinase
MVSRSSRSSLASFLARADEDRRLGPFRLLRQLGSGGFAPVWLAEETYDGRKLRDAAVKLFASPDGLSPRSEEATAWRTALLEEARAICRVEHPQVVRFYSLQQDDRAGIVGLAMEYVAGESLEELLQAAGTLDEYTVAGVGESVAWALSAVHHAGLVHRDVKPANIIRSAAGYKLIDFGIVVEAPDKAQGDEHEPGAQPLIGTLGYIAPECLRYGALATAASDLYALGATLFRLLVGLLPDLAPAGALARISARGGAR